jgi:hypothetical protein
MWFNKSAIEGRLEELQACQELSKTTDGSF